VLGTVFGGTERNPDYGYTEAPAGTGVGDRVRRAFGRDRSDTDASPTGSTEPARQGANGHEPAAANGRSAPATEVGTRGSQGSESS